jgi:uncharacterized membrane protein YedE/YeeE
MKALKYLLVGFIFGLVLTKSEAVSWYRIYEMFHFQSFHMYGIIATAVFTGLIGIQIMKRTAAKDIKGQNIVLADKEKGIARYAFGGLIFGLGWALVGTCPGPVFILIGAGFISVVIILVGALAGTFVYGLLRNYLPH